MTYKEFCEAVEEAEFVTVQSEKYTSYAGDYSVPMIVEKDWVMAHVQLMLHLKSEPWVFWTKEKTMHISAKCGIPQGGVEWQLITT